MTVAIEHETKPIPAKLVIGGKEIDVEITMIESKDCESSSNQEYSIYNVTTNTYTCVEQKYTEIDRLYLPPKFKGRDN